jgi:uncharacterized protein (TIGR02421 family)
MQTLSVNDVIALLTAQQVFTASLLETGLEIKIDDYALNIATAIHNGSRLRSALETNCLLSQAERFYEEDPFTAAFIQSCPITLVATDSRYEYDLNREPELCVYETAWGKQVWKQPLTENEKAESRYKHQIYYRVLYALTQQLEKLFGACLIYDVHSYNYRRIQPATTPTFNLGTAQVDTNYWVNEIDHYVTQLKKIELNNVKVSVAKNQVFQGKGYQAKFIKEHFKKTLILPTEVKKVFMNEETGEILPPVIAELSEGMGNAFSKSAAYFAQRKAKEPVFYDSSNDSFEACASLDKTVIKVDQSLYQLGKGLETLVYINPVNLCQEKGKFFARHYNYRPDFHYRRLDIDPYEFKEKLYRIPINAIQDENLKTLYRSVSEAFAGKIDLITTIGTEQFLYNSLRYYGEPETGDIENAQFLLYAKDIDDDTELTYNAEQAKEKFEQAVQDYGLNCKVEISGKLLAGAMVNNLRKAIQINKHKQFSDIDLQALINHELGVHMVTTVNAELQPLKVFKLGLPGNTHTQEGLAVLGEYLSGNLTYKRLKTLALRVIAVEMMVKKYDFSHTFQCLMDTYQMDSEQAFNITARVYRGGGFTKDFLYLKGLRDAYHLYQQQSLDSLFIGKTSFASLDLINQLIEGGVLKAPQYLPLFFQQTRTDNPILNYIISSIR